jgi:hypothetical protein
VWCGSSSRQLRVQVALRSPTGNERHVLHVRVTDDQDPFLLYTLDVDESDYARCAAALACWLSSVACVPLARLWPPSVGRRLLVDTA